MSRNKAIRTTLILSLLAIAFLLVFKRARSEKRSQHRLAAERETRAAEEPPFISELPQIWTTPQDYQNATGKEVGAFKQSPYFDEAVASGQLPPVEERLPEEPLVVLGVQGIGKYGGIYIESSLEVYGALSLGSLP